MVESEQTNLHCPRIIWGFERRIGMETEQYDCIRLSDGLTAGICTIHHLRAR